LLLHTPLPKGRKWGDRRGMEGKEDDERRKGEDREGWGKEE